jgi:putative peptidoglycan lipid II flippase
MGWATTLIQFPHGLVATAISIAILPTLSRQAAQAETQQPFRDTLGLGLRLTTVLILPATLGLFVLGTPIVRLLFEHGQFGAADTLITVQALRLYLFGLPFAGLDLLLIYAFYARQDTLTPAWVGFISLVVYMVVALGLVARYGLYSLMIADSVKHLTHTGLSAVLLWQRLKGFGKQNLGMTMLKSWVASCLMGAVGWLIVPPLQNALGLENWWAEILLVLLPASLCMVVYVGLSFVFRLNELLWLVNWARQRR